MFNQDERSALERLIRHAKRDTNQGCRVASFLLSWWNAPILGGFDVTDLWMLDKELHDDVMIVLIGISVRPRLYPNHMGYEDDIHEIIRLHR
jgi:hypothetical protein